MKKPLTCIVAVLLGLTAPASAFAQKAPSGAPGPEIESPDDPASDKAPEDVESELHLLLAGHHGLSAKKTFEARFDNPAKRVRQLAIDSDTGVILRKRSVSALAYWPNDRSLAVIKKLLRDESSPQPVVFRALSVLANHYPERAVPLIRPYLDSPDPQTRLTAIHALRAVPNKEATDALRKRLKIEHHRVVRESLKKATLFTR